MDDSDVFPNTLDIKVRLVENENGLFLVFDNPNKDLYKVLNALHQMGYNDSVVTCFGQYDNAIKF